MLDRARRLVSLMSEPSRDDARDPSRLARVERTRAEMMEQGDAIAATLRGELTATEEIAARLQERAIDRVVIVGCGDSWFVGMGVRHAFEQLTGWPIEAAQALEFAAYGSLTANDRVLVIGLSAGGNTPAVIAALTAARSRGAFAIGVSNTPGSAILTGFDAGLVVHATRHGWPTQSSTAAMALLIGLATALARRKRLCSHGELASFAASLEALPGQVDLVARGLDEPARQIAESIAPASIALFTGLGPNFAAAAFGAAKLKELSPIHAFAIPLEEMHHYRAQKRGDPLFLIATDPASRERALDTALVSEAVGSRLVALLSREDPEIACCAKRVLLLPPVAPALAAIVSSVPLHLLAYHFAKTRFVRALGYPGAFPDA